MSRRISWKQVLVVVLAILFLGSGVVSAAVSTSVETNYNGTQSDTDQAVQVTYTLSPEGDVVNNLTIDFDSTRNSFIESNSFSYTISPGGAEVNVESQGNDQYFIRELESNEEIVFTFEIYPKQLKQEQLEVGTISVDYIQNGQQLSQTDTVTADLSNSPWFALEDSKAEAESLRKQISGMRLVMFGGAGLGALGLLAAVGAVLWKRKSIKSLKEDLADNLDQLESRMISSGLEERSTEHQEYESWRRDVETSEGIPNTAGGFNPSESNDGSEVFEESEEAGSEFGESDSSGGFSDSETDGFSDSGDN